MVIRKFFASIPPKHTHGIQNRYISAKTRHSLQLNASKSTLPNRKYSNLSQPFSHTPYRVSPVSYHPRSLSHQRHSITPHSQPSPAQLSTISYPSAFPRALLWSFVPLHWDSATNQNQVDFIVNAGPRDLSPFLPEPLPNNLSYPPELFESPRVQLHALLSTRSKWDYYKELACRAVGHILRVLITVFRASPLRIFIPLVDAYLPSALIFEIDKVLYLTPDERLYAAFLNKKLQLLYARLVAMAKIFVHHQGNHQHQSIELMQLPEHDLKHPNDFLIFAKFDTNTPSTEYSFFHTILQQYNMSIFRSQLRSLLLSSSSSSASSTIEFESNNNELTLSIIQGGIRPQYSQSLTQDPSLLGQLDPFGHQPLPSFDISQWFWDDTRNILRPIMYFEEYQKEQNMNELNMFHQFSNSIQQSSQSLSSSSSSAATATATAATATSATSPQRGVWTSKNLPPEGHYDRIFDPRFVPQPAVPKLLSFLTYDMPTYQMYRDYARFKQSNMHLSQQKPYTSTPIGLHDLFAFEPLRKIPDLAKIAATLQFFLDSQRAHLQSQGFFSSHLAQWLKRFYPDKPSSAELYPGENIWRFRSKHQAPIPITKSFNDYYYGTKRINELLMHDVNTAMSADPNARGDEACGTPIPFSRFLSFLQSSSQSNIDTFHQTIKDERAVPGNAVRRYIDLDSSVQQTQQLLQSQSPIEQLFRSTESPLQNIITHEKRFDLSNLPPVIQTDVGDINIAKLQYQLTQDPYQAFLDKVKRGEISLSIESLRKDQQTSMDQIQGVERLEEEIKLAINGNFDSNWNTSTSNDNVDLAPYSTLIDQLQLLHQRTHHFHKRVVQTLSLRPHGVLQGLQQDPTQDDPLHNDIMSDIYSEVNQTLRGDETTMTTTGGKKTTSSMDISRSSVDKLRQLAERAQFENKMQLSESGMQRRRQNLTQFEQQKLEQQRAENDRLAHERTDLIGGTRRSDVFSPIKPQQSVIEIIQQNDTLLDIPLLNAPPESILQLSEQARFDWICEPLKDMTPREIIDLYDLIHTHHGCMLSIGHTLEANAYHHYEYLLYQQRDFANRVLASLQDTIRQVPLEMALPAEYSAVSLTDVFEERRQLYDTNIRAHEGHQFAFQNDPQTILSDEYRQQQDALAVAEDVYKNIPVPIIDSNASIITHNNNNNHQQNKKSRHSLKTFLSTFPQDSFFLHTLNETQLNDSFYHSGLAQGDAPAWLILQRWLDASNAPVPPTAAASASSSSSRAAPSSPPSSTTVTTPLRSFQPTSSLKDTQFGTRQLLVLPKAITTFDFIENPDNNIINDISFLSDHFLTYQSALSPILTYFQTGLPATLLGNNFWPDWVISGQNICYDKLLTTVEQITPPLRSMTTSVSDMMSHMMTRWRSPPSSPPTPTDSSIDIMNDQVVLSAIQDGLAQYLRTVQPTSRLDSVDSQIDDFYHNDDKSNSKNNNIVNDDAVDDDDDDDDVDDDLFASWIRSQGAKQITSQDVETFLDTSMEIQDVESTSPVKSNSSTVLPKSYIQRISHEEQFNFFTQHCHSFVYFALQHVIERHMYNMFTAYFSLYRPVLQDNALGVVPELVLSTSENTYRDGITVINGDERYTIFSHYSRIKDPSSCYLTYVRDKIMTDFNSFELQRLELEREKSAKQLGLSSTIQLPDVLLQPTITKHGLTPYGSHLMQFIETMCADERPLNPASVQQLALSQPFFDKLGISLEHVTSRIRYLQMKSKQHQVETWMDFTQTQNAFIEEQKEILLQEQVLLAAAQPTQQLNPRLEANRILRKTFTWLNLEDINALQLFFTYALDTSSLSSTLYKPFWW